MSVYQPRLGKARASHQNRFHSAPCRPSLSPPVGPVGSFYDSRRSVSLLVQQGSQRVLPTSVSVNCERVGATEYPEPASATVLRAVITPRTAATSFGRPGVM
jgi:hypothetical protein